MVDARLLGGRYRLLAELGRGGMGRVWRARDELLDREVAVKEVAISDGLPEPDRQALMRQTVREARLAARLAHPHIVTVHDMVVADGRPWIVLELVSSRTLASEIGERGPLPAIEVIRLGLEVLAALRTAHAAGVLHRDIKPANILLTGDGRAILTDFGLAITPGEDDVIGPGMVMGTPAYLSPERAAGGPSDEGSDLWSLGATLYAAVEGRAPFGGSTQQATLSAVVNAAPEPFSHAGPLAPVISGLLAKDPALRPDAAEVHDQLIRLAALHHDEDPHDAMGIPGNTEVVETGPMTRHSTARAGRPTARHARHRTRIRDELAVHWRQVAAIGSLVVAAIATASWPPTGTSVEVEPPPLQPARIQMAEPLHVLRVSAEQRATPLVPHATEDPPPGETRKHHGDATEEPHGHGDGHGHARGHGDGRGHGHHKV
ncbi:serine/threonine-protein kinase [Nonomuraea sp. NPDC050536]|uniref:serine/threonine-protein kinase n=1 Tax=Nonomuraea sp. NPDC050536 TaxID=3364366 RepID=UPI0037C70DB7